MHSGFPVKINGIFDKGYGSKDSSEGLYQNLVSNGYRQETDLLRVENEQERRQGSKDAVSE